MYIYYIRRANARNVSFQIPLRRPIHIINSVDNAKSSCNTPHRHSTSFIRKVSPLFIYYIDTRLSVLLENTPLVKVIRNHIQDSAGIFSISSLIKILITSLISCLTLKLYLNLLAYDQHIFESPSKVFGNLRLSSDIFGNVQKLLGNVHVAFTQFFGESLYIIKKWSKVFPKSSKTSLLICLYAKQNNTWSIIIHMEYLFSCSTIYLTALVSQRSWVQIPFRPEFFSGFNSQLLKLCITAVINHVFISFSAVQIYDLSYIYLKCLYIQFFFFSTNAGGSYS